VVSLNVAALSLCSQTLSGNGEPGVVREPAQRKKKKFDLDDATTFGELVQLTCSRPFSPLRYDEGPFAVAFAECRCSGVVFLHRGQLAQVLL